MKRLITKQIFNVITNQISFCAKTKGEVAISNCKDNNPISLDQSKIDAARTTLNAEYAALEYSRNRAEEYPSIEDQLDTIYHSGVAGWKTKIKAIKDKYPKPS